MLLTVRAPPCVRQRCSSQHNARVVIARFQRTVRLTDRDAPSTPSHLALVTAEADLRDYCDEHEECTATLDWFVHKCHDAEAALATGASSNLSEEHDRLLQTLRELAASGSLETLVRGLTLMKRLEERRVAQRAEDGPGAGFSTSGAAVAPQPAPRVAWPRKWMASAPGQSILTAEQRTILIDLFNTMDVHNDGRLQWSEFQRALQWIGDSLSEDQQELVASALDLQGSVGLDEFLAIVELAEAERARGPSDAPFLRHLTHHHPEDLSHLQSLGWLV